MTEYTDWIINEIQNWSFRIEDIILHVMTGMFMGITIKIKSILRKLKDFIKKIIHQKS